MQEYSTGWPQIGTNSAHYILQELTSSATIWYHRGLSMEIWGNVPFDKQTGIVAGKANEIEQ